MDKSIEYWLNIMEQVEKEESPADSDEKDTSCDCKNYNCEKCYPLSEDTLADELNSILEDDVSFDEEVELSENDIFEELSKLDEFAPLVATARVAAPALRTAAVDLASGAITSKFLGSGDGDVGEGQHDDFQDNEEFLTDSDLQSTDDDLESKKLKAKELSKDGFVQHVNKDKRYGDYYISDWYDDEETVASYENGQPTGVSKYEESAVTDFAKDVAIDTTKKVVGDVFEESNNNPDYIAYILVNDKIESGWEYVEDAREHKRDNLPPDLKPIAKIVSVRTLKQNNIDPNNDSNWLTSDSLGENMRLSEIKEKAPENPLEPGFDGDEEYEDPVNSFGSTDSEEEYDSEVNDFAIDPDLTASDASVEEVDVSKLLGDIQYYQDMNMSHSDKHYDVEKLFNASPDLVKKIYTKVTGEVTESVDSSEPGADVMKILSMF